MAGFGLALLGVVALLVATTGLPVFAVLLAASCVGAAVGVMSGAIPLALLGALPSRLTGLLENDLLQAVPLFVFIGALLDRLPLADLLYRGGCRLAGRSGASPRLAAMGLSALLAPMMSVISQFDGPMVEFGDVGGAITEGEHRRGFVDRRGLVQIVDGHQGHEHERRQC